MESMRNALRSDFAVLTDKRCENLGLQFEKLIPNIDVKANKEHVNKDTAINIFSGYRMLEEQQKAYRYAFNAWKDSMEERADKDTICLELETITKMILGSGNSSAFDIGFQLNKPWGIPYISGSTIKGLLSSYLARHGGRDWQRYEDKNAKKERKSLYQAEIFGGNLEEGNQKNAYSGSVIFNNAWLYPEETSWFTPDIITVHHQEYYKGKDAPSGMNNPIPVKILALEKKLKFFLSIQGDLKVLRFLSGVLAKALKEEGIGSKTAVGYGRMKCEDLTEKLQKERADKTMTTEEITEDPNAFATGFLNRTYPKWDTADKGRIGTILNELKQKSGFKELIDEAKKAVYRLLLTTSSGGKEKCKDIRKKINSNNPGALDKEINKSCPDLFQ